MGGSAPQAQPITLQAPTPPKPPPGYDFVKGFAQSWLPQLLQMQLPSYQGSIDPGLSPTMQNVIRGAQSYSQAPIGRSLEQASGTLGRFMSPSYLNPSAGLGPAPNYGFNTGPPGIIKGTPSPTPSFMARGGAAGLEALNIKPMFGGGAAGVGNIASGAIPIPGPTQPSGAGPSYGGDLSAFPGSPLAGTPGQLYRDPGGYLYDPWNNMNLAFNPGAPGGLGDSRFGSLWNWIQQATGFTPGQQHGPGAQPWNAEPPAGFDYGRGGTINPVTGEESPWGWWGPGGPGTAAEVPNWLRGLNDQQLEEVFRTNNIPDSMRGPGDNIGDQIISEGLSEWGAGLQGGTNGNGSPARGGGGGGGMSVPFTGLPSYQPVQVNPQFVSWDPGNPVPSMVAGNNVMPPPGLPTMMPPSMPSPPQAPAPAPAPGPSPTPRPRPPAAAAPASPAPAPQQPSPPFFFPGGPAILHPTLRRPGGGGGGTLSDTMIDGRPAIQLFAEGGISNHPQLALIGEAGPEVVMPLAREAKDPPIRAMQNELGLPIKPMALGGASMPSWMQGLATAGNYRGQMGQPPNQGSLATKPGVMGGGNSLATKPSSGSTNAWGGGDVLSGLPSMVGKPPVPDSGWGGLPGGNSLASMPGIMGGMSSTRMTPGQGGLPTFDSGAWLASKPDPGPGFADAVRESASARGGIGPYSAGIGQAGNSISTNPYQVGGPDRGSAIQSVAPDRGQNQVPPTGPRSMADWTMDDWSKDNIGRWFKDQRAGRGLSTNDLDAFNAWRAMKGFAPFGQTGQESGVSQAGTRPARDPGNLANDIISARPGLGGNSLANKPAPMGGGLPGEQDMFTPPGGGGSPWGPTSAMDVYRSAVPVMQQEMNTAISDAMAQSGLTGNRFSSSAQNTAANIGGQYGLRQNQLMANLLYGQTQSDLDRALAAAGMAPQNALAQNQIAQDQLRLPFQIGSWEQGRQDQMARTPYEEFMNSRLGFLPMIMQFAASQGGTGGLQGQYGSVQTGGSPGFLDYAAAFAPYLSLFS